MKFIYAILPVHIIKTQQKLVWYNKYFLSYIDKLKASDVGLFKKNRSSSQTERDIQIIFGRFKEGVKMNQTSFGFCT